MIQTLLITIVPMLIAAAILMVGGVQLSKKSTTEIAPHDRERLLSFSHGFQSELNRLEKLYLSHLGKLAEHHRKEDHATLRSQGQNLNGIHSISIFNTQEQSADGGKRELPNQSRLVIGKRLVPPALNLSFSSPGSPSRLSDSRIPLPVSLLRVPLPENQKWLSTPSQFYKVHIEKPSPEILVALVIDYPELHQVTIKALMDWIERNAAPLTETNERIIIGSRLTPRPLLVSGPEHHGPAAAIIPYRSHLGDFEITAWDGIQNRVVYDPVTVTISSILAAALCLAGFLLFSYHQRTTRLARQRVSFVNQVSHELGTPLTNLNLNLELTKDFFDSNPTESKQRLGIVTEELTRLSRLVTNVLTFSQKERDTLKLHLEPCLPACIVSSVVDSFRLALERLDFEIQTDLPETPPLLLDPDALSQIVTNLISNVEKYASSGKFLRVSVEYQNEKLIVTIGDQGPGILKNQESRIFEPFRRLSQHTTEGVSGMGLGLAIAHELARKMNGDLELLPSSKGAHFQLTLPATPAP